MLHCLVQSSLPCRFHMETWLLFCCVTKMLPLRHTTASHGHCGPWNCQRTRPSRFTSNTLPACISTANNRLLARSESLSFARSTFFSSFFHQAFQASTLAVRLALSLPTCLLGAFSPASVVKMSSASHT